MRSLFAPLAPWVDQFAWLLGVEIHIPAARAVIDLLDPIPDTASQENRGFQFALHAVHCTSCLVSYSVRNVLSVDCALPGNAYALPTECNSR